MILPKMAGATAIFRILFVLFSSVSGLYGLSLGSIFLITHICSVNILGKAYLSSAYPPDKGEIADSLVRFPYKLLDKKSVKRKS